MKTYEIKKEDIKEEPVCFGYKAVNWDCSTKVSDKFRYGEIGENLVGKCFKVDGSIIVCESGLHFSKDPADVFNFYAPLGYNRYFKVAAYGTAYDSEDGKKTVAECIEFLEEYNLIEFINKIKLYDRSSIGAKLHNGVIRSFGISGSYGVYRSNGVSASYGVSASTGVSASNGVSESYGVNKSAGVYSSYGANRSNGVYGSFGVNESDGAIASYGINWSIGVSRSCGVNDSEGVIQSVGVHHSCGVYYSNGVSRCYGIFNCDCVKSCVFCAGIECKKNYVFNKKSKEDRVEAILSKLRSFGWSPDFNDWYGTKGNKKWWAFCFPQLKDVSRADAWSRMPPEMLEYIKSLPEFDEKVWEKITK